MEQKNKEIEKENNKNSKINTMKNLFEKGPNSKQEITRDKNNSVIKPKSKNLDEKVHVFQSKPNTNNTITNNNLKSQFNSKKSDFSTESISIQIPASAKAVFLNQMKYLTDKDPTLNDITMVYNDKITELFEENEKLQNTLKDLKDLKDRNAAEKEVQTLKEKISSMKKEKEDEIKNINEIYQGKLEEVFSENTNLLCQLDEQKKYQEENKQLKEIVVKDEAHIKDLEVKIERVEKSLGEGDSNTKLLLDRISELEHKLEDFNENMNHLESENTCLRDKNTEIQADLMKQIEDLKNTISLKEDKINENLELVEKLEKKLTSMEENETNLKEIISKDQIKLKELKAADKSNTITEENNILKDEIELFKKRVEEETTKAEEANNSLNKLKEEMEKILQQKDENIANMNTVIEKMKKDFEEKENIAINIINENKIEKDNLLSEENTILKGEIELFKKRLEEEIAKVEQANHNTAKIKEEMKKDMFKRDKAIEKMNSVIEKLKVDVKEKDNKINELVSNASTDNTQTPLTEISNNTIKDHLIISRDIIVDYVYHIYLYDNSISVQNIIEIILNNFNIYMCSIFNKSAENSFSSFSLLHEFLEDIYFTIFNTYVKNTYSKNRNASGEFKWKVSQEDISPEIMTEAEDCLLKNNLVTRINLKSKKTRSVDEIIDLFLQKYKKTFNNDFFNKEVKPLVVEKVERHNAYLKVELSALLKCSVHHFNSGKIVYNSKEVYDFEQFFKEYLNRDFTVKDTLFISKNLISSHSIDNVVFEIKNSSENLKSIYFVEGSFNNNSEPALSKLTTAMVMYCNYSLQNLTIANCVLSENQIFVVAKLIDFLKNLKFLDLGGDDIKEEGVKILSESLKTNKSIIVLHLDRNNITSNGGFYLADALMKNNTLEKLSLARNEVNDNGLYSLFTVLANNNHSLRCLDISDNQLLVNDFKNISECLQTSQNLAILNLSYNLIEQQSANYLGIAIKQAPKLTVLYLQNTGLYEENAPLFLKSLIGSHISEVYLDDNPMGDVVIILLANILKINQNIKYISLKNCNLSSISLICLSKLFENVSSNVLSGINIENNKYDDKAIELFITNVKGKNIQIYLTASLLSEKARDAIVKSGLINFILY